MFTVRGLAVPSLLHSNTFLVTFDMPPMSIGIYNKAIISGALFRLTETCSSKGASCKSASVFPTLDLEKRTDDSDISLVSCLRQLAIDLRPCTTIIRIQEAIQPLSLKLDISGHCRHARRYGEFGALG